MSPIPLEDHLDLHLVVAIKELESATHHMRSFNCALAEKMEIGLGEMIEKLAQYKGAINELYQFERMIRSR